MRDRIFEAHILHVEGRGPESIKGESFNSSSEVRVTTQKKLSKSTTVVGKGLLVR